MFDFSNERALFYMYQRTQANKLVLQGHVDEFRDKQGCGGHPEIYDWLFGARSKSPKEELVISGNGNYAGKKLRAFARDTASHKNFKTAFKASKMELSDVGGVVTLKMTVPKVRGVFSKGLAHRYHVAV